MFVSYARMDVLAIEFLFMNNIDQLGMWLRGKNGGVANGNTKGHISNYIVKKGKGRDITWVFWCDHSLVLPPSVGGESLTIDSASNSPAEIHKRLYFPTELYTS